MSMIEVRPNTFSIALRIVSIGLAGAIIYLLLAVGLDAPAKDQLVMALLCLLPLFLLLLPALRGLFLWPVRISFNPKDQFISTTSFTGTVVSFPVTEVREMQPRKFWHGGRTSFEGLILQLKEGKTITLSCGNLRSVEGVREALTQAGVPVVERTATGRPLKK